MLVNQFASGLSIVGISLIFVLMLELTSSTHRGFTGNLALIAFTIGEIVIASCAYLAKNWEILKWVATGFMSLVIPYLYFMPESPLYFYSQRNYIQLEALLRRIATTNRRKEEDWYPVYQEFLSNQPINKSNVEEVTFMRKVRPFLSQRSIIKKLLISILFGFTTLLLYFQISYGLAMMSFSPYVGILVGAIVETAGYLVSSVLISSRLGRKISFMLLTILTMVCVVLIGGTMNRKPTATAFIAQLGKFAISASTATSWIYVPELFPTAIRGSANGLFIAFGRIGAIIAPVFYATIGKDYLPYTFYISASLAFIVVLLTLLLPETKHLSMDAEEDDIKNEYLS